MALDESFKRPGTIPFKWELQPGVPKQQPHHGGGAGAVGSSSASSSPPAAVAAASTLLLPPRLLAPPPAAAAYHGGCDTGANILASTTPSPSSSSHWRSMSARFTASLVLPFTRPRRGRSANSKDEDDIAFTVLYGDKIV
uniref:Uncharacterized protein n=1 Tax=Oryza meridionalis TaxID=40149 RepID=A0A0E0D9C0_9ORYZ